MTAALPAAVDVLVAGGGPAGSALALALLRAGVERVAVAPGPPSRAPFRVGESASPGVAPALEALGLSGDLAAAGHLPCRGTLSLWGGERVFDGFRERGRAPGWHLDRAAFDRHLLESAGAGGATLLPAVALETVTAERGGWRVRLRGGLEVRARIVADCTARRTAVAARLGVGRRRLDRLLALAVMLPQPEPPPGGEGLRGFSLVEAADMGWWYAAPVPGGRVVAMLITDADLAATAGLHRRPGFAAAWAAATELRRLVPVFGTPPAPVAFPAPGQYLEQACGPGWIAAGDALIAMDPLTAAGIDGALGDARAAADTLTAWLGADSLSRCLEAGEAYRHRAEVSLRRYLGERALHYRREVGRAAHPFWGRRAAAVSAPMPRGLSSP